MKKTFIYPGQGSQSVGMGITVADTFPAARAIFDAASSVVGYDMYKLCSEGPVEKLANTVFTQPSLYTVEASITTVLLEKGLKPYFAAGHSHSSVFDKSNIGHCASSFWTRRTVFVYRIE